MSNVLHLNLLNPHERKSSSPVRARILLPVGAGICLAFVLLWGTFVGVQYAFVSSQCRAAEDKIASLEPTHTASERIKAQYRLLQASEEQFGYYLNGRCARGELLRQLAYATPEGVTLTALKIPPPPEQNLRPPPGSKQPPLQGPTETSEKVELRLTGLAQTEQDVFQFMNALKGSGFTNLVVIAEHPEKPEDASPRVLAFRQESPFAANGRRDVFFDIVYTLKPRVFVK